MNNVHDMGGMQGMGPIAYEKEEPVFHEPWEGRVYALSRALRAFGRWSLDADRYALETMPPEEYLRMSYYERWLKRMEKQVVEHGLVTREEFESGKPDRGAALGRPALTAAMSNRFLSRGIATAVEPGIRPRFEAGQRVRARNLHPAGHTRLPRYARGKTGEIARDHGVYLFPDTNAHSLGENRQHVYSVRFAARELWGEQAPARDAVFIDMWDEYLEPISG